MNIFVLDLDPKTCAEYHCDKHVIKMITEHNQLLCSTLYSSDGFDQFSSYDDIVEKYKDFPRKNKPYKISHFNHPCSKWLRESYDNVIWLLNMNLFLCYEYTKRYKKIHKGEHITKWLLKKEFKLPKLGITDFAQAMPNEFKNENVVLAYREYYKKNKSDFAVWKFSNKPNWF